MDSDPRDVGTVKNMTALSSFLSSSTEKNANNGKLMTCRQAAEQSFATSLRKSRKSLRLIAFVSVALSTTSVLAAIITLPMIYSYVQAAQSHMQSQVDFCKSQSQGMWKEMVQLQHKIGIKHFEAAENSISHGGHHQVVRRQAKYARHGVVVFPPPTKTALVNHRKSSCCKCNIGFPGPVGRVGVDGRPGNPGRDGAPGRPGRDAPTQTSKRNVLPKCQICPPGIIGAPGFPGAKGIPGALGDIGKRGFNGVPGLPGPIGPPGSPGSNGVSGSKGPRGPPGKLKRVAPPGNPGKGGQPGQSGKSGTQGTRGLKGPRGSTGPPGDSGDKGRPGARGPIGARGSRGGGGYSGTCDHCPQPKVGVGYKNK